MSAGRDIGTEMDWDAALQAIDGHFLQSTHWQHVQEALGHDIATGRGDTWMWSGAVRRGAFPRYMYVPYGPASRGGGVAALESVLALARSRRLDFVRVEPDGTAAGALSAVHAQRVRGVQPRWTWVLDIDGAEETLRQGLSSGHRGSINAAERRGIRIRCSRQPEDIDVYLHLQHIAGDRSGFAATPDRYHRTVARVLMPRGVAALYVAEAEGQPVAAAMCFDFGPTRYYAHAVSDPGAGRRLGAAAPLVWRMILDARGDGMRRFDFWGVRPDPPPGHPWAGFTRFKMAFGGHLVERVGTWEIALRASRYALYNAMRRVTRR